MTHHVGVHQFREIEGGIQMTIASGGMQDNLSINELDFLSWRHLIVETLSGLALRFKLSRQTINQ